MTQLTHKSAKHLAPARILAIVVGVAALLAACGNSKSDDSAASTTTQAASATTKAPAADGKFIQANFVDPAKIYSISKYRSLAGHDFSGNGETCRSMKHYMVPLDNGKPKVRINSAADIVKPNGIDDTPIYSPVDGTITQITEERTPIGAQIRIRPTNDPAFTVRLFHVWQNADLKEGATVKAGEQIGSLPATQETDIAIENGRDTFLSYFDVLPDSLFEAWKGRGLTSRADVVLTKEYRDANAVTCDPEGGDQQFHYPAGYNSEVEDYVQLTGYVAPVHTNNEGGSGDKSGGSTSGDSANPCPSGNCPGS